MSAFSFRLFWEDIFQQLRCNKRRALLCSIFLTAGVILGVVVMNLSNGNRWCLNRFVFAEKLSCGGFLDLFFAFFAGGTLCAFALALFSTWRWTQILCCVLAFVQGIYCGANSWAILSVLGAAGILYLVFVVAVGQIVNWFCCFWAFSLPNFQRRFCEALEDCRQIFFAQISLFFYKLIIIFVVLRLISASV